MSKYLAIDRCSASTSPLPPIQRDTTSADAIYRYLACTVQSTAATGAGGWLARIPSPLAPKLTNNHTTTPNVRSPLPHLLSLRLSTPNSSIPSPDDGPSRSPSASSTAAVPPILRSPPSTLRPSRLWPAPVVSRIASCLAVEACVTMNSQGANDVSPEAMQARIQQARREAETLKDRIKRKKDELSDTTRTCPIDARLPMLLVRALPLILLASSQFAQLPSKRMSPSPRIN